MLNIWLILINHIIATKSRKPTSIADKVPVHPDSSTRSALALPQREAQSN